MIDLAMTVMLPILMAYELVGKAAHEWVGTVMLLMFILHHTINRHWHKNFFKGNYTPIRILGTIINILLFFIMISLMLSGIIMSQYTFSFLSINDGKSFARILHLLASYWGFVLMSLHAGLHVNKSIGIIQKHVYQSEASKLWLIFLRTISLLLACYGAYALFQRQIGSYLFLQSQYVFFDYSEPLILFFADYIAMMMLFACMGHYAAKWLRKISRKIKYS
ncbi:MAG: rane protein [Paenibacillaceae bacterium]|nr:rane protein [Paenibacillaceae bacterium]